MISHQDRCLFVHIPKVAGQSIESVFVKRSGLTWNEREALLLRPNRFPEKGPPRLAHLTAQEYIDYGYLSSECFDRYFKFSFVRNPWARIVSEYNYRRLQGESAYQHSFKTFLLKYFPIAGSDNYELAKDYYRHVIPQSQFLYDTKGQCLVDFVGKFETLQQDFDKVCQHLAIASIQLPHKNMSKASGARQRLLEKIKSCLPYINKSKHYSCYYDDETRAIIAQIYKSDINLFNYKFESK